MFTSIQWIHKFVRMTMGREVNHQSVSQHMTYSRNRNIKYLENWRPSVKFPVISVMYTKFASYPWPVSCNVMEIFYENQYIPEFCENFI
jgi:hypothetical protein